MTSSRNPPFDARRWKAAYRAAIFCDVNTPILDVRISDAESAIVARTRELFTQRGSDVQDERNAMDDALYALRALRNAKEHLSEAA